MMQYLNIVMQKNDPHVPWGFYLTGGTDVGQPLTIQQVTKGTIASMYLHSGDVVVKIGNSDALLLGYKEANNIIQDLGNTLELLILKRPHSQSSSGTPTTPGTPCFTPPPPLSPNVWSPATKTPPFPPHSPANSNRPVFGTQTSSSSNTYRPVQAAVPQSPSSYYPAAGYVSTSPVVGGTQVFPPTSPIRSTTVVPPAPPPPPPLPPPPPPMPSSQNINKPGAWRTKSDQQNGGAADNTVSPRLTNVAKTPVDGANMPFSYLPPALHNTAMQKDKKPFTYTPGGLDFSELRSPRMQRRIGTNANTTTTTGRVQPEETPQSNYYQPDHHHQQQQQHPQSFDNDRGTGGLPGQSRSFRVLQALTIDDGSNDGSYSGSGVPAAAKRQEAEMRFTGLRKTPIPSKAFQTLQKMTGEEDDYDQQQQFNHNQQQYAYDNNNRYEPRQDGDAHEEQGEIDPRYRGPKIPSRSFKMLQEMTGSDNNEGVCTVVNRPVKHHGQRLNIPIQADTTPNPQPEHAYYYVHPSVPASQQPVDPDPKKYSGGHIPSRSFRMLQAMTDGEEEPSCVKEAVETVPTTGPHEGEVKMYMGGKIPSRSFRMLQHMTGEDGTVANGADGITDF